MLCPGSRGLRGKLLHRWWARSGNGLCVDTTAAMTTHLPILMSLNKNCRLRLLFSMTSSSVTVTVPVGEVATPIMAKFFRNSHPKAPAPTRNSFRSWICCCIPRPKTATWLSYRDFCKHTSYEQMTSGGRAISLRAPCKAAWEELNGGHSGRAGNPMH